MMLGSKGLLTPLIPDCSALRALTILKNIRNPLIFLRKMASYSCFWRVPRLKIFMQASLHQISNLLTLVSCNENMRIKKIWLLRRKETMVIKLAVPNQFRLKMVPTFKSATSLYPPIPQPLHCRNQIFLLFRSQIFHRPAHLSRRNDSVPF